MTFNKTMADRPGKIQGAYIAPSPRILFPDFSASSYTKKDFRVVGKMRCNFCKKNGEPMESYSSHRLRNEKGFVECPILRSHVCKFCKETGDNAHTISYCPYTKGLLPIIEELDGRDAIVNMGDLRMTHFSAAGQRQLSKKFKPAKKLPSVDKLDLLVALSLVSFLVK